MEDKGLGDEGEEEGVAERRQKRQEGISHAISRGMRIRGKRWNKQERKEKKGERTRKEGRGKEQKRKR